MEHIHKLYSVFLCDVYGSDCYMTLCVILFLLGWQYKCDDLIYTEDWSSIARGKFLYCSKEMNNTLETFKIKLIPLKDCWFIRLSESNLLQLRVESRNKELREQVSLASVNGEVRFMVALWDQQILHNLFSIMLFNSQFEIVQHK